MKSSRTLLIAAALVAALSGCSSAPTSDQPAAPIENRGATTTPGGGAGSGPNTGTAPGGGIGGPNTIDLTRQKPAGDNLAELKQGLLGQRSVFFDFDSDAIKEQFRPMLQAHAGYMGRNKTSKMLIQGNTDERGSREYNIALGQRRAEAVKKTLVLMGAGEGQIEAVSLGEEKPRRTGSTEADYAENRRGDILYGGEF
jgi:peptidoglycan-associated lipoprotein